MTADILDGMAAGFTHVLRVGRRFLPVAILEMIAIDQIAGAARAAQDGGHDFDAACLAGVGVLGLIVIVVGHVAHVFWSTNE